MGLSTSAVAPASNVGEVTDMPEAMPPTPEASALAPAGEPANDDRREPPDLDAVERDLADAEAALGRLDDGSYWRDEVTGEEITDEQLAANPLTRRADS